MRSNQRLAVYLLLGIVVLLSREALLLPLWAQEGRVRDFDAASALSQRYETVAATSSDYLLNFVRQPDNDPLNMLRAPFVDFIDGLSTLGNASERGVEQSYQTILVGVKDFRSPKSFGLVRSEKCYVGVRSDESRPNLATLFSNATVDFVGGLSTWQWQTTAAQQASDPTTIMWYASQVNDTTLLMCSDRRAYIAVSSALRDKGEPGFTAGLPNLFQSNYWIVRSVRHEGAVDALAAHQDQLVSTRTLIFIADTHNRTATVVIEGIAPGQLPRILPETLSKAFISTGPARWAMRMSFEKQEDRLKDAVDVLDIFGFGLYL